MKRITVFLIVLLSMAGFWLMQGQTFSENFDSQTAGQAPAGWTSYTTQTDDPGFVVVSDSSIAHSIPNFLAHFGEDISQESTSWIVSPAITLGSNQELVFYWREKWSYAYNYSGVYISTGSNDPINNPSDFTELAEFDPDDYPDTWNTWNKAMFDLRNYDGQTVYIAFKYVGDFAHDFYVDDIQVSDIPYCNPTPSIQVDAYTDSTLTVSWDAVTNQDVYEIVWGPQGFDPNNATPTQVTGTTYTITGLQPATWYDIYVRTACSSYNYSSWSGPEAGRTSGPPPANDTCGGAISLTVNTSCTPIVASNFDTTDSGTPDPGCGGYNGGDVWFTVTVPTTGALIVETSQIPGSNVYDTGLAAYSGDCSNLTLLDCDDDGGSDLFSKIMLTGLNPGDILYIRAWEYGNDSFGEFGICAYSIDTTPPANDDCANAINLTVTASCSPTVVNNIGATDSGAGDPGCAYYQGGDIWFTVVIPSSGNVTIETTDTGGAVHDTGMAVYSGDCNNLTQIQCDDDGGSGTYSLVQLTGRTAGETVYVRVWEYGNNSFGEFGICAHDPSVSVEEIDMAGFKFYPNPANGTVNLSADQNISKVEISNLTGQIVQTNDINNTNAVLNIQNLPAGVYMLTVYINGNSGTYRLIKE